MESPHNEPNCVSLTSDVPTVSQESVSLFSSTIYAIHILLLWGSVDSERIIWICEKRFVLVYTPIFPRRCNAFVGTWTKYLTSWVETWDILFEMKFPTFNWKNQLIHANSYIRDITQRLLPPKTGRAKINSLAVFSCRLCVRDWFAFLDILSQTAGPSDVTTKEVLFRWTIYIHNAWITRDWPREAWIICHLLLVNLILNEVWQLGRCHCKYNGNEKFTYKPLLTRQKMVSWTSSLRFAENVRKWQHKFLWLSSETLQPPQ